MLKLDAVKASADAAVAKLVVHPGQTALLFGRNRYGPLLRVVLGLADPVEGTVELLGQPLADLARPDRLQLRARCGVLTEKAALISNMNVFDNVALPLRYHHEQRSEEQIEGAVSAGLERWGLDRLGQHRPHQLHVSQMLRVALVRCLLSEPELVVLENPFEPLDDEQRGRVDELIDALTAQGAAVLVIDA